MTSLAHRGRSRRALTALGALALGGLVLGGVVAPAAADPITEDSIGNIDFDKSGEPGTGIVVHKYAQDDDNGVEQGDGTATPPSGSTIDDALFTITPVLYKGEAIDLESGESWDDAETAFNAFEPATATFTDSDVTLGTQSTAQATVAGVTTFDELDFGVYLVREVPPLPAGVINASIPFLVSVPFPTGPEHSTNPNEWLYQVHVYPKNATTGIEKNVNDDPATETGFYTAGDYVSWTIASDIPVLAEGNALTKFIVTDTVLNAELKFATGTLPAGISPRSVTVLDADGDPVAVTDQGADPDYTIAIESNSPDADHSQTVVTFTATGLAKLDDAGVQGGQVILVVPTQVVAVPSEGLIQNDARLDVNDTFLTDSDSTDFGQLRVFKYAETSGEDDLNPPAQTPLAGAKFALYVDVDGDGVADDGEVDPANRVTVDGENEWTSDEDGLLDIAALKVGHYLLVETAAPVGYTLNATPRPVNVLAGVTDTTLDAEVNYVEVKNDQIPEWLLPFTGGNGVMTFTLIGVGLMALAFGLAFVAFRRRRNADQAAA